MSDELEGVVGALPAAAQDHLAGVAAELLHASETLFDLSEAAAETAAAPTAAAAAAAATPAAPQASGGGGRLLFPGASGGAEPAPATSSISTPAVVTPPAVPSAVDKSAPQTAREWAAVPFEASASPPLPDGWECVPDLSHRNAKAFTVMHDWWQDVCKPEFLEVRTSVCVGMCVWVCSHRRGLLLGILPPLTLHSCRLLLLRWSVSISPYPQSSHLCRSCCFASYRSIKTARCLSFLVDSSRATRVADAAHCL